MYTHLLIATDGSSLADAAVAQGLALAKALKAKVTAVTVTEPLPSILVGEATSAYPVEHYVSAARANAREVLARVTAAASGQGVSCDTVHVEDHFPAEGIIETAQARKCDLIVMASHGRRGLAKLFLGSQATRVLSASPVPVLICK